MHTPYDLFRQALNDHPDEKTRAPKGSLSRWLYYDMLPDGRNLSKMPKTMRRWAELLLQESVTPSDTTIAHTSDSTPPEYENVPS